VGTAARCNKPGTRTVIFVQGLYSTLDADGTQTSFVEEHRFQALKAAFVQAGFRQDQLLDFSYAGGAVRGGVWQPQPYGCALTDRAAMDSVLVLESMVRDLRSAHPDTKVTLVGHSLGGYIAFLAGTREAGRTASQRIGIDGVVTLDAPLAGASPDKKAIVDLIPCEKTYVAGSELVDERADPTTPERRRTQAAAMAVAGVRLATLGNLRDCLYRTTVCAGGTWIDDSATQFVDTAELSRSYEIASEPLQSHDIIVADATVAADVVSFVGNP
jgi:pimeloyl-ACP methyl ester carboxylesterase